jgi:hypothetical protein
MHQADKYRQKYEDWQGIVPLVRGFNKTVINGVSNEVRLHNWFVPCVAIALVIPYGQRSFYCTSLFFAGIISRRPVFSKK